MNTKSEPSRYRKVMSRRSTVAVSTFVPALKVRSTTLPVSTFFNVVRTNAPPLPGLTCWNAVTVQSWPSRLSTRAFFRSFVDATGDVSCVCCGGAVLSRAGMCRCRRPDRRRRLRRAYPDGHVAPRGARSARDRVHHLDAHRDVLRARLDRDRLRRGVHTRGRDRRPSLRHLRDRQDRAKPDLRGVGELPGLGDGLPHG